jgi:N-acetyl-alpha-D-muramate 1-phosphate uridylyltransferase
VTALPVAILAGGLASRLHPLTQQLPKALLPIAGRPFIFHQLEWLKREGIRRVVLCVGHLGDQIQAAVEDGRTWGLTIEYSFDGPDLLGTGGALRQALELLGDEFFVVHGDSYAACSLCDIESAYRAAGQPALMTVLHNDNRWDKSNVLFRHGRLIEYGKQSDRSDMTHIDFGVSILSREAFHPYMTSRIFDLAELYRSLSLSGRLSAFQVSNRFYEIGSFGGIRDTEEFMTRLHPA